MTTSDPLRDQLVRFLDWHEAHVDFEGAIKGIPPDKRGATPPGFPHSPWQLMEHLRIAQEDIHDFCVNSKYQEMKWPEDYWPASAPPTPAAWDESVAAYRRDNDKLKELVRHQPDRDEDQQSHQADVHPARRQRAQVQVGSDGHRYGELHDFRGLEAEHAQVKPALRALGGVTKNQHQHEQQGPDDVKERRGGPIPL